MYTSSYNLKKLQYQNGDVQRTLSSNYQTENPWVIVNMLSINVEIMLSRMNEKPEYLLSLKPNEKKELNILQDEDQLIVCYRTKNNNLVPFLLPYVVRSFWKKIVVGAVEYSSDGGKAEVQASFWDMRGVWIHNMTFAPLNIYYKNNLVAQVYAYNGTGYMGGGASMVYFDNDREGLNLGDELSFSFSVNGMETKRMVVILDDTECLSIYVGKVLGSAINSRISVGRIGDTAEKPEAWGPEPDFGVFRINNPSYTGVTYYESGKEQYRTYPTPNIP